MNTELYREACRRKHRVLGHYLAIQAWLRKLDCIALQRRELEHFLGLERFKSTRVEWLINDLKPWFPYHVPYYLSSSPSSIHTLFLSRVEIASHLPKGKMTTDQRILRMTIDGPKTEKFLLKDSVKPPSEEFIVSELALVTAGLRKPTVYPLES
jgi:hypothetical protein